MGGRQEAVGRGRPRGKPRRHDLARGYLCLLGANQHKGEKKFLASLAAQLIDPSERALKSTSRLIVWERIVTGEILFEGKGFQVEDDVFTVAGRANWMLRSLAEKNFGYVKPRPSPDLLHDLQGKWNRWLAGESVQEYSNPFQAAVKGLEEIRSLIAIEALIVSLQPSKQKDEKTAECLRNVYHLEKLPTDPGAPGHLCSPDPWAYGYLSKVTGVSERHDPTWWSAWWRENRTKLTWDSTAASFVVRSDGLKSN